MAKPVASYIRERPMPAQAGLKLAAQCRMKTKPRRQYFIQPYWVEFPVGNEHLEERPNTKFRCVHLCRARRKNAAVAIYSKVFNVAIGRGA